MSYGYEAALEAAGATVLRFEQFGSYQGDWLAQVGPDAYVRGSYGSCSGCDAFEAEFGFDEKRADYQTRLAAFGKEYLDTTYTRDELVKEFTKQSTWDMDAKEILTWLKAETL